MSYKDDDSILFPTRFGPPIGTARERTMIDNCGGAFGIVRRVRENPDGSSTLLRTRAGNPDFITDESGAKGKMCWRYLPVVDHGFVDTRFSVSGINDSGGGKLHHVINAAGVAIPDASLHLNDTHAWKEQFYLGTQESDGIVYGGLPSNFSGLMRRLVQVWYGTAAKKKEQYAISATEECPKMETHDSFCCRYVKTHGVYVNSLGKRWIIEVSSDGVYRIPITFSAEFSTDQIATAEDDLRTAYPADDDYMLAVARHWSVTRFKRADRELIGAAPSAYAEGYAPWYAWCGWGFDYTGKHATITLARQHPSEPSWFQSAVFDLTISEADGVPSYVSCVKSEESDLMSPFNDTTDSSRAAFQIPSTIPGYCVTQTLFSPVGHSGPIHAPIFSFYDTAGRQVYYFDTYAGNTSTQSFDNRQMVTVNCPRSGSWFYSTFAYGTLPSTRSIGGVDWTLWAGALGETSGYQTGAWGGWYGFSGSGMPAQNTDFNGVKCVTRDYESGPNGWTNYLREGGPRSSVRPAFTDGSGSHPEWWDDYSWGGCSNDNFRYPATAIVCRRESATHDLQKSHYSTLVLDGHDREAIRLYVSKHHLEQSYSVTGNFRGNESYIKIDVSAPLFSRVADGTWFSKDCGPYYGGATDWCLYTVTTGGVSIPSTIQGYIDYTPANGLLLNEGNNLWNTIDCSPGDFVEYYGTQTYPAVDTWDRKVYIRLGATDVVETFTDDNIHDTYFGGNVFMCMQGASAFTSGRVFYQIDITALPYVNGVGAYTRGQRGLYGFIGAF